MRPFEVLGWIVFLLMHIQILGTQKLFSSVPSNICCNRYVLLMQSKLWGNWLLSCLWCSWRNLPEDVNMLHSLLEGGRALLITLRVTCWTVFWCSWLVDLSVTLLTKYVDDWLISVTILMLWHALLFCTYFLHKLRLLPALTRNKFTKNLHLCTHCLS